MYTENATEKIDDNEYLYTQIMAVIYARTEGNITQVNADILADALKDHPLIHDDIKFAVSDKTGAYIVWDDQTWEWNYDDKDNKLCRTVIRRALNEIILSIRYYCSDELDKEIDKIDSEFEMQKRDYEAQIAVQQGDAKKDTEKRLTVAKNKREGAIQSAKDRWHDKKKGSIGTINRFIDGSGRVLLEYLSKSIEHIDATLINRDHRFIKTPRGALDIESLQYLDDKAFVKSLYMVGCTAVDYVPQALCNIFERTIEMTSLHQYKDHSSEVDIEKQQAWIDMIHDILGFMVLGANGAKWSAWIVCPTNTGKSSIIEPPLAALGSYGVTAPNMLFSDRQQEAYVALGSLMDKRLAVLPELTVEKHGFNEHIFKGLTGGDRMMARILYVGYGSIIFKGLIIICANHPPHFEHASRDMKNRIKTINLTVDLTKLDGHIQGAPIRIRETELEGVFRLMIENASRLLNNSMKVPRFIDEVEQDTDEMFRSQTVYAGFIQECLVPANGKRIWYPSRSDNGENELTRTYEKYATRFYEQHGWKKDEDVILPRSDKLRQKLEGAGLPRKRGKKLIDGIYENSYFIPDYALKQEAIKDSDSDKPPATTRTCSGQPTGRENLMKAWQAVEKESNGAFVASEKLRCKISSMGLPHAGWREFNEWIDHLAKERIVETFNQGAIRYIKLPEKPIETKPQMLSDVTELPPQREGYLRADKPEVIQ